MRQREYDKMEGKERKVIRQSEEDVPYEHREEEKPGKGLKRRG